MTNRFKTQAEEDAEREARAKATHANAVKWAEARLAKARERARRQHEAMVEAEKPEEP